MLMYKEELAPADYGSGAPMSVRPPHILKKPMDNSMMIAGIKM